MMAPFALERYLCDLRDRTAWAPDLPIENYSSREVPREVLYRMAHLWTLALLDDRFDTLLLPILVTQVPILENLPLLGRAFAEERLESGACILFVDRCDAPETSRNRAFFAV